MEITITRTGGLQGVRQILGPVSTDDLSEADAIAAVIDEMKFFDLPAQVPSGSGADIFFYRTVVVDANRSHEVLSDDLSEEPYHGQLGRLIELLRQSGVDFVDQASGQDVDWDEVRVVPLFAGGFLVIVRGVAPVPTIVSFEEDPTEQFQDYAPVHIVGRRAGITIQVETPWEIQSPLERLPHGSIGTVLIGATKREYIPPKDSPEPEPY